MRKRYATCVVCAGALDDIDYSTNGRKIWKTSRD